MPSKAGTIGVLHVQGTTYIMKAHRIFRKKMLVRSKGAWSGMGKCRLLLPR